MKMVDMLNFSQFTESLLHKRTLSKVFDFTYFLRIEFTKYFTIRILEKSVPLKKCSSFQ